MILSRLGRIETRPHETRICAAAYYFFLPAIALAGPFLRNTDFLHDFTGLLGADTMDILQSDNHAFVSRYIDTGDAGHGSNSYCRSWEIAGLRVIVRGL
jgi:hypothetical protein